MLRLNSSYKIPQIIKARIWYPKRLNQVTEAYKSGEEVEKAESKFDGMQSALAKFQPSTCVGGLDAVQVKFYVPDRGAYGQYLKGKSCPGTPFSQSTIQAALDCVVSIGFKKNSQRQREAIFELIESGADVNGRNDVTHETALMLAVRYGRLEAVEYLLANGADVNAKDRYGMTALHHAIGIRSKEITLILLKNKCNVHERNKQGFPPIVFDAKCAVDEQLATVLLEHKARVRDADDDGWTALHWAAYNGNFRLFKLMLSKGVDKNILTKYCETPLLIAAAENNTAIASYLLSLNASKCMVDLFGRDAEEVALKAGHLELANMIAKASEYTIDAETEWPPRKRKIVSGNSQAKKTKLEPVAPIQATKALAKRLSAPNVVVSQRGVPEPMEKRDLCTGHTCENCGHQMAPKRDDQACGKPKKKKKKQQQQLGVSQGSSVLESCTTAGQPCLANAMTGQEAQVQGKLVGKPGGLFAIVQQESVQTRVYNQHIVQEMLNRYNDLLVKKAVEEQNLYLGQLNKASRGARGSSAHSAFQKGPMASACGGGMAMELNKKGWSATGGYMAARPSDERDTPGPSKPKIKSESNSYAEYFTYNGHNQFYY